MSLKESIESDYKTALKAKDKNKISTYRLILSGIKDLDINNRSGPQIKETDDDDIKKTVDYSQLVEILKDQSKKIYCFTIEKYSNAILEIIDQEFKLSKIKIILTKCNPPIIGFDGKVSIVRILENN